MMNLTTYSDQKLLDGIKFFAEKEREALIAVLHHLKEIERRRLFCDLGYGNLFDYAVKELKYSEDQAARRIQAMRLIRDVPEAETKIASGELSLSNAQKVQSTIRRIQKEEPMRIVQQKEKLQLIEIVSGKSCREAERELIKINPEASIPEEKERILSETHSEVRFVLSDTLRAKLERIRSLLGSKGAMMNYAELFEEMANITEQELHTKRFGKNRSKNSELPKNEAFSGTSIVNESADPRYIPASVKHFVWHRDQARCVNCKSTSHLNFDHIKPVALGGKSTPENLRLLCFACNQRESTKVFGTIFQKSSYV